MPFDAGACPSSIPWQCNCTFGLMDNPSMKIKDFLLSELEREVDRSRRALEQVPSGKYEWKPHEKSMIFGYLANMVATIPTWITMQINQAELDVAPANGRRMDQKRLDASQELL